MTTPRDASLDAPPPPGQPDDGRLRILLALESSGPGGAERVVLRLGLGLRRAGHDVAFLTLREGWLTERIDAERFPRWHRPQAHGLALSWAPRLAQALRRSDVDVLHAHEFAMSVYGGAAARLAGVPALATLHGHRWIGERALRRHALRMLARAGVGIGAVSRDLAEHVARTLALAPERIGVVPNGTELGPPPAPRDAGTRALRRELAGDRALLLAVGNLYPVKDHATALRALARVPAAVLAVAGRGREEASLRELASRLGVADRVRWLGLRSDVDALLRACDVLVHPSRREGLPMAILEAMAAGRPVVATRVGGIPEAVVDGETGRLVPPAAPEALAAALTQVLEDPPERARLGAAARRRAEQEFSVERMVERYETLYRECVAARRGRRMRRGAPSTAAPRAVR